MIQIHDKLISEDIFAEKFVCDLTKCKGICCVEGDAGAPLDADELPILAEIYPKVKPYLRPEGVEAIEEQGTHTIDTDGDFVTPLVNGGECAYVIFDEHGITKCAIEKAYEEGVISWQKPISCHLYPIRITEYKEFSAINYHEWSVCSPACSLGKELNVKVYEFLKGPLIRKYGEEFYNTLTDAEKEWQKEFGI